MAEITDIGIEDWSTVAADNLPTDAQKVKQNLPRQWRNKKSVFRATSLEKEWVRLGTPRPAGVLASSFTGGGSISYFADDGDLTERFPLHRKVRLRDVAGIQETVYAVVWGRSFTTVTTVQLAYLAGEIVDDTDYWVDLGADAPSASGYPLFTESGSITIADAATTGAITFAHKQPDVDYFLKTTVASTTSATLGAANVTGTAKSQTGATITLHDAPGVGFSTVIGWILLRELR